ncbi:MAG: TRAP transporter small permease [Desulfarculaceae bacterium]|jgi:TRAP-type C4-dicarboxylate transport system permease small subunit
MSALNVWRKLGIFSTLLTYIGACALFAMMLITVADVLARYVFNSPMIGVFELTGFLVLILIFSFIAYTQAEDAHVSVDFLLSRFPQKIRTTVELFNLTACLILMNLIAYMGLQKALDLKQAGETSLNLAIPYYPFVLFLVMGCLVACVEYIRKIIRLMADIKNGA